MANYVIGEIQWIYMIECQEYQDYNYLRVFDYYQWDLHQIKYDQMKID